MRFENNLKCIKVVDGAIQYEICHFTISNLIFDFLFTISSLNYQIASIQNEQKLLFNKKSIKIHISMLIENIIDMLF